MRILEIVLLALGILAFLFSAVVAGSVLGDIYWRAGVAIMLGDLVIIQLWPGRRAAGAGQ